MAEEEITTTMKIGKDQGQDRAEPTQDHNLQREEKDHEKKAKDVKSLGSQKERDREATQEKEVEMAQEREKD